MTRFSNRKGKLSLMGNRTRMFDVDPHSRIPAQTLRNVRDDLRLKFALRRAVNRDFAPQSLIDAIKKDIRG